jgi:hypothetical protein
MQNSNPLQSYFRRPALYLKLPSSGVGYSTTAIDMPENGELPIFPMTAIDEITSRTPDALFNGVAVAEIIKSCVPSIKDPWSILQTDLDALLLAIKVASNGNTMEVATVCPSCNEDNKYDVNLTSLLGNYKPGDYSKQLELSADLKIKFKPLTYKKVNEAGSNQFEVQYQLNNIQTMEDSPERDKLSGELIRKMNGLSMDLVLDTIEYVKTPDATVFESVHIKEFLVNCDIKTYTEIRKYSVDLKRTSETKPLDLKCIACSHEYTQPFSINVSDFFD